VCAECLAKKRDKSEGLLFHVDDPTTEKARRCVVEVRGKAKGSQMFEMQNEDFCEESHLR